MLQKTISLLVLCYITVVAAAFSQTTDSTIETNKADEQKAAAVVRQGQIDDPRLIQGRATAVYDGDTISVQTLDGKKFVIRLLGIDAPEITEEYGQESRDALVNLILEKEVLVIVDKKDLYDRLVGDLYSEGRDIGLLLISAGAARHYKEYSAAQTAENRKRYAQAELVAQDGKIGLWKFSSPPSISSTPKSAAKSNSTVPANKKAKSAVKTEEKKLERKYILGPKGGCYYINPSGNKTYVKDKSLCNK